MQVSRHKDRDNKNHKDLYELLNIDLNIALPAPGLVKPILVTCILRVTAHLYKCVTLPLLAWSLPVSASCPPLCVSAYPAYVRVINTQGV